LVQASHSPDLGTDRMRFLDPVTGHMEQRVEAADLDTVHQILSTTYGAIRIAVVGGRPAGMRLASATLGSVRFDRVSLSMAFEADGDPLGAYVFGQLTGGRVRHASDRCVRHYLPGEVFLAAYPDHPYTAAIDDTAVDLAVVDPTLLDDVAESAPGRVERPVRFTGYQAVSTRATERWKSTYAYVHAEARNGSSGVSHPLVAGNAARLLVATALATFPNTALAEPTIEDRHDAHPATLRRAIAFIEGNADCDISVADIARAAHVTARAVQLAFRRHLGTTPSAYLRRVRLQHAHDQLHDAVPGTITVSAVAARWGFLNPSLFAAHYRTAFAVLPSRTLQG
jgi:AraC-like DNA-binding protein